jgi:hypothetical protein
VVRLLREHLVEGRLGAEEFEERAEAAYSATTLDELEELTRDLPVLGREREPTTASTRRVLMPGNRPFAVRFYAGEPADTVISKAMRTIAPSLLNAGYRLESTDPSRLVFRREYYALWRIVAALLVPLIGLVVLLAVGRDRGEVVVSANELEPGRTVVDVFGVGALRLRRALRELEG